MRNAGADADFDESAEDYAGDGWASAIDMDAGTTLYVSNRKHDSVSVYHLYAETGRMSWMQNIKTGGEQPRFLTVSPDGEWVVAANEVTDTIVCFKRNENGSLQENPVVENGEPSLHSI